MNTTLSTCDTEGYIKSNKSMNMSEEIEKFFEERDKDCKKFKLILKFDDSKATYTGNEIRIEEKVKKKKRTRVIVSSAKKEGKKEKRTKNDIF